MKIIAYLGGTRGLAVLKSLIANKLVPEYVYFKETSVNLLSNECKSNSIDFEEIDVLVGANLNSYVAFDVINESNTEAFQQHSVFYIDVCLRFWLHIGLILDGMKNGLDRL